MEKINKKKLIALVSVILAVGIAIILLVVLLKPTGILPKNGSLDLSDFQKSDSVTLRGEWDFYWEKLLTYEDIAADAEKDTTADTSSFWNNYKIGGEKLPAFGYATYVLNVINAPVGKEVAIKIPVISTAYELYIDGERIASCGTVGTDKESHVPERKQQTAEFTVSQPQFNIILRISNFTTDYGGIYDALTLGGTEEIRKADQTDFFLNIFSLGALLVMIVYYLSFIFLVKGEKINRKINLILVLLCALYAIRILLHAGYLAFIGYRAITVLDYLLLVWFSTCGLYFFGAMFPKEVHKKVQSGLLLYSVIISAGLVFTPISFFSKFILLYEIIAIAAGVYLVFGLTLAFVRNRNYAAILLAAALVVLLCTVKDFIFSSVPFFGYAGGLVPFSILFLLLLQPFLHAHYTVVSLNKIVDTESAFMQAQIKPHFIYNVLSAISSYCDSDPAYAQKLIDNFSAYLRLSFDFKKIETCVPIEREMSLVKAYIEIQKARFPDVLSIEYELDEGLKADVPLLSIQPLVENAIIHGVLKKDRAGNVKIKITATDVATSVFVIDDGVGISSLKLKDLLSEENESGIGLYNIDKRLKKLFGKGLSIESIEGEGTTVSYIIPQTGRKR